MKLTERRYHKLCASYAGYCEYCDKVTRSSGVEPDARGYDCPKCNKMGVMGMENALIEGCLEVTE